MKPLTLDKALELYELIGKYLPEVDEEETPLDFVGKIVSNIRQSDRHKDYVDAVILMSEKDWEEIKQMDFKEVLNLFIEGISENKIIQLKSFCEITGLNHG